MISCSLQEGYVRHSIERGKQEKSNTAHFICDELIKTGSNQGYNMKEHIVQSIVK